MVVWRLPEPAPPYVHPFKYRLICVVEGERMIGFDNEGGKGDHSHIEGEERPYTFAGVDRLIEDFIAEVERWNSARLSLLRNQTGGVRCAQLAGQLKRATIRATD